MYQNFLKKLQVFGVLFGAKARKLTGLRDRSNFLNTAVTATTDTLILAAAPSFLKAGDFFRILDSGTPNDGLLFKVINTSGNIVVVDDAYQPIQPFTGSARIDSRIAIIQNNPLYSKLDINGNTIFNASYTGMTPTGQPYDLTPVMAAHYHDEGGVGPVGKDYLQTFTISDWISSEGGNTYKIVVSHNLGTISPGVFIFETPDESSVKVHREYYKDINTIELYVTQRGADARFNGRVRVEKS